MNCLHAVVIDRVTTDPGEAARAIAAVLGKTAYEVRPSVQLPGGGPAVVAVLADPEAAAAIAAGIRAIGLECAVVPVRDPWPDMIVARRFELGAAALGVESREGTSVALPHADIDVLLRGTRQTQTKSTERVTERKIAIGRAILSGGLVNTRTETTTR
ncbi:MAG TPA: hypothetical protein VFG69_02085, partial [Nannocystaceae bacterium]|nr:hypothetical protein [Nannocystaceae bacterium]